MSNLLKSKFLLGVMTFAIMFVGAVALNATPASADCSITTTLRQGSTGAEVVCLQTALGGLTADGKFGPMTTAAVKVFQANEGLTADGVFGPASRAAWMANQSTGNFPAGCNSAVGFSTTTGMSCAVSSNFPAGCTSTSGFSVTTGGSCSVTTNLPAGCSSSSGFSATTGASCSGGSSNNGPLSGGAGSATITELSTPSTSTKVGEGDSNKQIYGVEIEADNNSDLSITSMKLSFVNSGSGSTRFERYAKSVSIWYGGVKVGSADADDFSESSNTYSKSISLSNAIVRADEIGKFYVAVDAVDDIDSGNTGSSNNTWTVTLNSTRYEDGSGAIITDTTGSLANTFIFDTLASTSDVELKVNLSTSTPMSKTVKVSDTQDTNQVELLKFTMKAQGSAMHIDEIPVSFTTSGTLFEVTGNVTLVIDGQTFNESIAAGTDTTGALSTMGTASTAVRLFDGLDLDVDSGETITGIVYADINDIESPNLTTGTTLLASITSALVALTTGTNIDVEDSNGDQLVTGDRTGSAVGNVQTFRSTGVNTVMGTPTYQRTTDTNGLVTSVTYTIPVAVTSFGNTLYIGQSAQLATAASASNAFALILETAALPNSESVSGTTSITLGTSDAIVETNGFRLDDDQTKHFTIIVTMTAATDNTSIRFRLDTIRTFTEAGLVTATNSDLLPVTNFRTDFQYINN